MKASVYGSTRDLHTRLLWFPGSSLISSPTIAHTHCLSDAHVRHTHSRRGESWQGLFRLPHFPHDPSLPRSGLLARGAPAHTSMPGLAPVGLTVRKVSRNSVPFSGDPVERPLGQRPRWTHHRGWAMELLFTEKRGEAWQERNKNFRLRFQLAWWLDFLQAAGPVTSGVQAQFLPLWAREGTLGPSADGPACQSTKYWAFLTFHFEISIS